jgi:hypothetical protein
MATMPAYRRQIQSLTLVAALLLPTESSAQTPEDLSKRIDELEKRLQALETKLPKSLTLMELLGGQGPPEGQLTGKADLEQNEQPKFAVTLAKAQHAGRDTLGQPSVRLEFRVKNLTGRDVSLVNARIVVADVLDNILGAVEWEGSKGMKNGQEAKMAGTYTSTFGSHDIERIPDTDPKLLKITFEVEKIAFADGEIVNFSNR